MLNLVSVATTIATVYLCEHPEVLAEAGLQLQLNKYVLLTWLAKTAYKSISGIYGVFHRKLPCTNLDEIAQFAWFTEKDAELVARVTSATNELKKLQCTEVPIGNPMGTDSITDDEYQKMFNQMQKSYSLFTKWHDLGFQGKNPATDFRGAGKLGVLLFHHFCTTRTKELHNIIQESNSNTESNANKPWYPLALVSIRLSNAISELLKREKLLVAKLLQHHLEQNKPSAWLETLFFVHDELLVQFHSTWVAAVQNGELKTYFDNEIVLKKFEQSLPLRIYRLN